MHEDIELLVDEGATDETPGFRVSGPTLVSIVVHALLILFLIHAYHPVRSDDKAAPIAHYIELIKQNPRNFTEAPGPKIAKAPLNAPYSDANRKASGPKPNGNQPTIRPGDGRVASYTPPSAPQPVPQQQQQQQAQQATQPSADPQRQAQSQLPPDIANNSRMPALRTTQAAATGGQVNWHSVIKEVKVASLGGNESLDVGKLGGGGGEKGFFEQGPVSFETQWYDWGEYAQSMVSKIRVNWYEVMPPLIRTGMKGVVTIRFTIQHDGSITDVEMLNSSAVPPYDFAAKKAIELSSKLNPLPKDFPEASERVTCMFFYNSEPPVK
ncbi:MAG TPA: energy transducer TonB [Thermoanaerobaculia bacterium]